MTRPNSALVLRRASERLTAGAAAVALTFLMLLTVDVRAAEPEAAPAKVIRALLGHGIRHHRRHCAGVSQAQDRCPQGVWTRRRWPR